MTSEVQRSYNWICGAAIKTSLRMLPFQIQGLEVRGVQSALPALALQSLAPLFTVNYRCPPDSPITRA